MSAAQPQPQPTYAEIHGLVTIRFVKRWDSYNPGEVASFKPLLAARLIDTQGAELVRPKAFDHKKTMEVTSERPQGPTEEDQAKRQKIVNVLSAVPSDEYTDGKPDTKALSDLLGYTISDEQRDAAWESYVASASPVEEPGSPGAEEESAAPTSARVRRRN